MMNNIKPPVWTKHHDEIVERYEQRVREGKIKEIVIYSRDE